MKHTKKLFSALLATVCVGAGALCFSACEHKHDYSDEWKHDETSHWHECLSGDCEEKGDKANHEWNNGVTSKIATCTVAGEKTYTCKVCGTTKVEQTETAAHNWDSGTVVKEASCVEAGEIKYSCQNSGCTETKNEPIATVDHTWDNGTVTTPATCQAKGVKTYSCTVTGCDETKTEDIAISTEHKWDSGTVTTEPTCQATGVKTFACTVTGCTETKTETLNKTGHNFAAAWSKDATNHWHACQTSSCTEKQGNAAHSWGSWVTTTEPTEQTTGTKKRVCTVEGCGAYEEDTVPVLNHEHSYTDGAYETSEAQHWQICKDTTCKEPTEKVAHSFDSGVTTKPATALEEGVTTYTCSVCKYEKTEPIAKIPAYVVRVVNIDGTPAEDVTVVIDDAVLHTDENGYAIINNPQFGDYAMFVQKSGYVCTASNIATGEEKQFNFTIVPEKGSLTITESGTYRTYIKGTEDGNGGYTFSTSNINAYITLNSPDAISQFNVKVPSGTTHYTASSASRVGAEVGTGNFEQLIKRGTYNFFFIGTSTLQADENGYAIIEFEVEVLTGEDVDLDYQMNLTAEENQKFYAFTRAQSDKNVTFTLGENVTGVCAWEENDRITANLTAGANILEIPATSFTLHLVSTAGGVSANVTAYYDDMAVSAAKNNTFSTTEKEVRYWLTVTEAKKYTVTADTLAASLTLSVYSEDDLSTPIITGNKFAVGELAEGKYLVSAVMSTVNADKDTMSLLVRPYMDYDAGKVVAEAQIVSDGDRKQINALGSNVYQYYTFTAQEAGVLTITNSRTTKQNVYFYGEAECATELNKFSNMETATVRLQENQKVWIRFSNTDTEKFSADFSFTAYTEADKVEQVVTIKASNEPLDGAGIKIFNGDILVAETVSADGQFTFTRYPFEGKYRVEVTVADPENYTIDTSKLTISNTTSNLLGISKNVSYKVIVKGDDDELLEGVTVTAWGIEGATDAEGSFAFKDISHSGSQDANFKVENVPAGYKEFAGSVKFSQYTLDNDVYVYECVLETPKAHTVTVKYGENPAGAGVKVEFTSGDEVVAEGMTNEEGVATLTAFKGSYKIELSEYDAEYAYKQVSTSASTQEYELTLTEAFCDYTVTVDKYDGTKVEGALVYLYEGTVIVASAKTNEDGVAEFGHYTADGGYTVAVLAINGLDGVSGLSFTEGELDITLYPVGAVKGLKASSTASTYAELFVAENTFIVAETGANGFKIVEPNSGNGARYTITLSAGCKIDAMVYHSSRWSATNSTQTIKDGVKNADYTGTNGVTITEGEGGTTTVEIEVAKNYKLFMKINAEAGYGYITVQREELPQA